MRKHNRDHRRMVALANFYRRHTPFFLETIRENKDKKFYNTAPLARELLALESRLPPEMVAWAKLNR